MSRPLLADAFAHHVWATLRLVDACLPLNPEQLETTVEGTYGSIMATMRHLIGGDVSYLFVLTGGRVAEIEEDRMNLWELRAAMEGNGPAWASLLAQDLDPDSVVVRHRDDGIDSHAPMGIRLAQVLHHGTDHRSQICTALTTIGVEPPDIDVWAFATQAGRLSEVQRTS
jgi:uncharacterized damage-inducible protein DinB